MTKNEETNPAKVELSGRWVNETDYSDVMEEMSNDDLLKEKEIWEKRVAYRPAKITNEVLIAILSEIGKRGLQTKPPVIKLAGMHRESIRETNPATGHTPGPWDQHDYNVCIGFRGEHCITYKPNRTPPAVKSSEYTANARLIAAAPDMLAALKELVDIGGADQHGFAKTWTLRDNEALSYRLRAAIAKAEGGAS